MTDAVSTAAKAAHDAADDVAACIPAFQRASRGFERLVEAARPLDPRLWTRGQLLSQASTLVQRSNWHLQSAKRCLIPGAIRKRERFLQAYRQLLATNQEVNIVLTVLAQQFPDTTDAVGDMQQHLDKTEELARTLLEKELDIPFVKSAADGPGPKTPLS
jgi:hypothetical protein